MILDKASIFTAITRRNALRLANGLPPLDVAAEYAHEVSVARQRDYRAFCELHAAEHATVRQQVLEELRETHGPDFGMKASEHWQVGVLARQRFDQLMTARYDMARPAMTGRNGVTCGEDRNDGT
jgi:hypothetical protein